MIHPSDRGTFTISSRRQWLPGVYESEAAARYAFLLDESVLQQLQDEVNELHSNPELRVITLERLQSANSASSR